MSVIVFAGAAQFAAVGYVASGLAWPGDRAADRAPERAPPALLRRARPWLADVPLPRRAVMAHLLTDEAFALSIGHFRRIGRTDEWGYWMRAIGATFIPWNLATLGGRVARGADPGPGALGIDIIFPAAMIGLAVGLITGRRELVAAIVGAGVGGRRGAVDEPVDRDRRGRHHRAGWSGCSSRASARRDGAARDAGIGRAVRDAGHARRRADDPPARRRPIRRTPDPREHRTSSSLAVLMFAVTYPTAPSGCSRRGSTACRRSPSTTSSSSARPCSRPWPRSA